MDLLEKIFVVKFIHTNKNTNKGHKETYKQYIKIQYKKYFERK